MSDDHRKRPRFPRPLGHLTGHRSGDDDDEVMRIPPTERTPILPPAPEEPFRLLTAEEKPRASWLIPNEFRETIQKMVAGHNQILQTQRNMALQVDGLCSAVNQRFDVFHKELAMLRSLVAKDGERLDAVELSLGEKAKRVATTVGSTTLYTLIGGFLVEVWPQYAGIIRAILHGGSP